MVNNLLAVNHDEGQTSLCKCGHCHKKEKVQNQCQCDQCQSKKTETLQVDSNCKWKQADQLRERRLQSKVDQDDKFIWEINCECLGCSTDSSSY